MRQPIFFLLVLLVAGCGDISQPNQQASPPPASGPTLPAASFTDQDGQTFTLRDGVWYYFFCKCPSICPKMSANASQLAQQFPKVQFVGVTITPKYDDLAALRQYKASYGGSSNWHLVRNDNADVAYSLADAMGVASGETNPNAHDGSFIIIKGGRVVAKGDGVAASNMPAMARKIKAAFP